MNIRELMVPFATSIWAKKRALASTGIGDTQKRRFRESISDDIRKASDLHPHKMSVGARNKALALDPPVNLADRGWHDQHKFDPDREMFLVEHKETVSALRDMCMAASDENKVLSILTEKICVVWILREEDEVLSRLKYRSSRPDTAYQEATIEIWNDKAGT